MDYSTFSTLQKFQARRAFLQQSSLGLGSIALASMMARDGFADSLDIPGGGGDLKSFHHAPKAKRVIYLFMSGGPSHIDLYDHKPLLKEREGEQLPDSVRGGQRLTGMSGNQSSIPLVGSPFEFKQYGPSGAWFSDLLPHTAWSPKINRGNRLVHIYGEVGSCQRSIKEYCFVPPKIQSCILVIQQE